MLTLLRCVLTLLRCTQVCVNPTQVHTTTSSLQAGATERVLDAGDFMYLPAGFVHQVGTETSDSCGGG